MNRRPVALLDACVLVPMPLADTLLRLAEPLAIYEARWSEDILGEMSRTLGRRFATTLVYGYLVGHMGKHPKDRRVPAAALTCKADHLVTFNLRDFPAAGDITAIAGPSTFLKALGELDRTTIEIRLREQADAIGFGVEELLDRLAQSVPALIELLRRRD